MGLRFKFNVQSSNLDRDMTELAKAPEIVDQALTRFGKYLRAKAQKAFAQAGPGWPPLAKSTEEHRASAVSGAASRVQKVATDRMRSKLKRELQRAVKSGSSVSAASRLKVLQELERVSSGQGGESVTGTLSEPDKQVQKQRMAISKQLRQAKKAGNEHLEKFHKQRLARFDSTHADALDRISAVKAGKSIQGLGARIGRAQKKAAEHLLGKMASSISAKVSGHVLTVQSKIDWSSVHNEGGSAGHGAHIPKREFLSLDEDDTRIFSEIFSDVVNKKLAGE